MSAECVVRESDLKLLEDVRPGLNHLLIFLNFPYNFLGVQAGED
jgi:hypothetical protein